MKKLRYVLAAALLFGLLCSSGSLAQEGSTPLGDSAMSSEAKQSETVAEEGEARVRQIVTWVGSHKGRLVTAFVLICHTLGFLTSIRAVLETRTAQGATAWVIALNTFPYVSLPAYWVLGRTNFNGYVVQRQAAVAGAVPLADAYLQRLKDDGLIAYPERDGPLLVERIALLPITRRNEVDLLVDARATYDSIFEGIASAEDYVLVEYYIIQDDGIGNELRELLQRKAREGVTVHLVYDEVGSSKLSAKYIGEARAAGIEIFPFNTRQGESNRWQINFRNHRKIVVVDGKTAWVGGINIGDEHLGLNPDIGAWRDTHVRLTGPAVHAVQVAFLEDWMWATGTELRNLNWVLLPAASGGDANVISVATGPADEVETSTLFFLSAINRATERVWIATPYFVPDEQFLSALKIAALRGCDVRIIVPDSNDNQLVHFATWALIDRLKGTGIQFYRYEAAFMHQKVMLIDDHIATVGTANFDNRSFRLNFEINIAVDDEEFAGKVAAMLESDLSHSRAVGPGELEGLSFWRQLAMRSALLTAPIL